MAVPAWFSSSVYLSNKLDQLHEAGYTSYDPFTLQQTLTQAGFSGSEGLYTHFVYYGMKENVSPNSYFDPDFYFQAKAADYFGKSAEQVTQSEITFIKNAFSNAGLSAWEHYQKFGVTEKLDPSANFSTEKYLQAKLNLLQASDADTYGSWTTDDVAAAFKSAGYTPVTHYFKFGIDEGIAPEYAESHGGAQQDLTTGTDDLTGTIGDAKVDDDGNLSFDQNYNDYFNAEVGTLQSVDKIDGLGGSDTLYARVNASSSETSTAGSIEPTVTNVETILFRSQIGSGDSRGTAAKVGATIDADRISLADGQILTIGSDNSRADLAIEDVRHDSSETIVRFANADPAVNFYVYFDPQHLTPENAVQNGLLQIKIMDVKNAQWNSQPLTEQPFNAFTFAYSGSSDLLTLEFRAEDASLYTGSTATYSTLLTAFQHALADFEAANPSLAGKFSISLGSSYTATATVGTDAYSSNMGQYIVLSSSDGTVNATEAGTGWGVTTGVVPALGGIVWGIEAQQSTTCPLIEVTVELDNVGRVVWGDANPDCLPDDVIKGSDAGDLQIGSMSMRSGIERMDVKVDEGSWLSGLYSTNDNLRMITVEAKDINGDGFAGNKESLTNQEDGTPGQLYIGTWKGKVDLDGNGTSNLTWADRAHLLTADLTDEGTWTGLKDVAVFDATYNNVYEGDINIAAKITEDSYDKYFKYVDGVRYIDQMNAPTTNYEGKFSYLTGSGDDTINMSVVGDIASDVDFKLNINTGAGEDLVAFQYEDVSAEQDYNQKYMRNVTISTGDDADTVWFYGNGAQVIVETTENSGTYTDTDGTVVTLTQKVVTQTFSDGRVSTQTTYYDANGDEVEYSTDFENIDWQYVESDSQEVAQGAGSTVIYGGSGADTIYANQFDAFTGGFAGHAVDPANYNAVFVFNSQNLEVGIDDFSGATLNNNIQTGPASFSFAPSAAYDDATSLVATITFKGFSVEQTVSDYKYTAATSTASEYTTPASLTAETINHAIIDAIDNDAVLSKLIAAKDGAGHSLLIESLINGKMDTDDLSIDFKLVDSAGDTVGTTGFNNIFKAASGSTTWYNTQLGQNSDETSYTGNDDSTGTQVVVDAGSDDDVIVLGKNGLKDVVLLNTSFGNDTLVDFETGIDKINVKNIGLNGTSSGTASSLTDDTVSLISQPDTSTYGYGVMDDTDVANMVTAGLIKFAASAKSGDTALVLVDALASSGESDHHVYTAVLATDTSSTTADTATPSVQILGSLDLAEGDTLDLGDFGVSSALV